MRVLTLVVETTETPAEWIYRSHLNQTVFEGVKVIDISDGNLINQLESYEALELKKRLDEEDDLIRAGKL
jgi:hypothetical protein